MTAEVKLRGFYNTTLLPDYSPFDFNLKKDKLIQLNILDSEVNLIPCWDNFNRLCPATLVLCIVTLNVWNLGLGNCADAHLVALKG